MKKLLFFILALSALACVLSITVSAEEWFGEVEIIDNNGDGESDIDVSEVVPNVVTEGDVTSESARVKLSCDCGAGYHTFPAYYVCTINSNARNNIYGLNYARLNALKNEYCGGTEAYTLSNVIAFEIPAGYKWADAAMVKNAASLKYFSFAKCSTATSVGDAYSGNNWLSGTPVEEIDLGPYLTKVPTFLCNNCDSLKSVTIPDQIVKIGTYAFNSCDNLEAVHFTENSSVATIESYAFKGCVKLGAFYIPKGVTSFGASGSGTSPIAGCTNLYFVNSPDETEKPSVYYFPTNVINIVGEAFKSCQNLNDVIVFHDGITSISDGWAFNGSNAISVVFLGNMESISTSGNAWNSKITLYFCNEADKSNSDITTKTSAIRVFCHGEGNETHLKELSKSTEATCEMPKMVADYCFCGSIMGVPVTEGIALGHNYTGAVSYTFTTVVARGEKCTVCINSCGKDLVESLEPVYTELGFSASTFDKSITNGYKINKESLALYEEAKGVTVKLGFAFNAAEGFTDGEVTLDSFKLKAEVANQYNGVAFAYHDFIVTYADDKYLDSDIIVGAYVIEKGTEGDTVSFINRTYENGVNGFEAVSYNGLLK